MIKINSVNLIGRWTRDHELRFSNNGVAILKNAIAVKRPFSKEEVTDFFEVTVFGKIAENTAEYTSKGRLVGITGRLQQDRWTTKEGQNRSRVVVIANSVEFLGYADSRKPDEDDGDHTESYKDFQSADIDDSSIPF